LEFLFLRFFFWMKTLTTLSDTILPLFGCFWVDDEDDDGVHECNIKDDEQNYERR